ncbi:GyrI-like domain-containing protein [Streptomyces sp. GESEQ-35]|uniref:GyrI-like domain-containing protein n=1 Tax=Streptomyces sp. GESEQ-35 TaxID=2812657 RepID=UPI001B33C701|nr:GyrI-like domain-containing protein [Streptomyces sp. GESEQ-35]
MTSSGPDLEIGASEPELINLDPATTAAVRRVIAMAELRDFFDTSFRVLADTIATQRVAIVGPAFCVYHGTPGQTQDLEVGFVTDRPVHAVGDVVVGSLPGGNVARLTHFGSFDGLESSWQRLQSWLEGRGLSGSDVRWECYVTQPTPDMDPRDLRTELNWPVTD